MRKFKNLSLVLLLITGLAFTSCKKKEKAPEPQQEETLLDKITAEPWTLTKTLEYENGSLVGTITANAYIQFYENGTYISDNGQDVDAGEFSLDESKNPPEMTLDGDIFQIVEFSDSAMKLETTWQNNQTVYKKEIYFER